MTNVCKTEQLSTAPHASGVERAAAILRGGGLVAFPTETVYGLGANALDARAVDRIFEAKARPGWDPLIVHISGHAMLERVAELSNASRERLDKLMEAFWPGPLTLLLPRTAAIPDAVTAGRPLVGVRMPAHPVALELVRLAGVPIAAPSANRFGHISPTTAAHVLEDLDGRIDAVLDGGPTQVGIESTVLDASQTPMVIYRPGTVTAAMLAEAAGCETVRFQASGGMEAAPETAPSPGAALRHYAPAARMVLVEVASGATPEHALQEAMQRCRMSDAVVGVMLPEGWNAPHAEEAFPWGAWGNADQLAQRLFAGLRALDARGVSVIVCPKPEGVGVAAALRDRLERAARGR